MSERTAETPRQGDRNGLQRARVEMAALHARFAHVLRASPTVLYELHVGSEQGETTTTFVSENVERILGYRPDDAFDAGWWYAGVHPDDRERAAPFLWRIRDAGAGVHTYRFRHGDGYWIWIQDDLRITMRHPDSTFNAIGSWTDVTIPKRSQLALQESERSYRALFESLRENVVIVGLDGRILGANQAALETHGYAWDELIGQEAAVLADAEHTDPYEFMHYFRDALAGKPVRFTMQGRRRTGETFPAELSFSRGRYFGTDAVIGVGQDISVRHEAQQRLAAAEEHYRRIVETSPNGIFMIDRRGCVIEVNPAATAIVQRSAEELLGSEFTGLLAPEDRARGLPEVEDVLAGLKNSTEYDVRVQRPSGETRVLRVNLMVVRDGEEVRGAHGVARDITDEIERDQHLRRVERLATIGTLIGGVAHELNNPLQAINSFASLLLEEERSAEKRADLETIRREAERASRVVTDLRLLARDTQEGVGRREHVELNDIVRHVLRTREYTHYTRNIEVRADLAAELPALRADPGGLEQVLINLMVNAEQAMEEQTSQRLLIVRTRATGGGVGLHVVDSGPGIPQEHLGRIFDPFYTTKARSEGTGLGLALAYKIISEHGGQIQVESEPGRGAAFHIQLPGIANAARTASSDQPEPPAPARQLQILVVDDEPALRTVLSRYLHRRGHVVDVAADGADALQHIDQAGLAYDVILSDLRMPGLGGHELLTALRTRNPGLERRIIFLTGEAPDGAMAAALEHADAPIIHKPIELADLAAAVERHAEHVRSTGDSPS
ncbi:MAG: hybrid sensor histidine kinase/response regulator [Longimicrobiales bacterium]